MTIRLLGLSDDQRLELEQATGIKTEGVKLLIETSLQQAEQMAQELINTSIKEVQEVIGPHGSVTRLQAGGIKISQGMGISVYEDGVLRTTIEADGDLLVGSNVQDPATTTLCAFVNDQVYNNEEMGAGDLLIGDNTTATSNVKYDASEGQLQFRYGTTVKAYMDTDGTLTAGSGTVKLSDTGIDISVSGVQKMSLNSDGDLFIGSDISAPATTTFIVFVNAQTYNTEAMGAGDILIGNNTTSESNVLWDASAKQLQFRYGTTVKAYVDTDGSIKAGAGKVTLDTDGVTIDLPATSQTATALKWKSGGVVTGTLENYGTSTGLNFMFIKTEEFGDVTSAIFILAQAKTGASAGVYIGAENNGNSTGSVSVNDTGVFIEGDTDGTGGFTATIVLNDQGRNVDTRIEGDTDTHLIFADASADKVGIGDSTPSYKLDVNGDVNVASGSIYRINGTQLGASNIPVADAGTYFAGTDVETILQELGKLDLTPGGRLTLTTGVPVTTSDVTAATTIYYTPYVNNRIRLWDGTQWVSVVFTEKSIALGTVTASIGYDVFGYLSSGDLALEKLAWTSATARATNVTLQDGRYCKSGDKTRLYLGSFYARSTTVTDDAEATRFLWNMYNRRARNLSVAEGTSHNYNTATVRAWNNTQSTADFEYFVGLVEDAINLNITGQLLRAATDGNPRISIAVNSTTTELGLFGIAVTALTGRIRGGSSAYIMPSLGYSYACVVEFSTAGTAPGTLFESMVLHGMING